MNSWWWIPALLASDLFGLEVTASLTIGGPGTTFPAPQIAGSIFRKAGVVIKWQPPQSSPATVTACLRVELVDQTPPKVLPGALGRSYPYCGCSKTITVFLDRVRAMAGRPDREPALLAYVLVHEMTHVIQGVDRHSESGIMKARWSAEDRAAIFQRKLDFADVDARLLRIGLPPPACAARPEPSSAGANEKALPVRSVDEGIPPERVRLRHTEETDRRLQTNPPAVDLDFLRHHRVPGDEVDLPAIGAPMPLGNRRRGDGPVAASG